MCRPTYLPHLYSCIIVASVYYPESAKNRQDLVSYLQKTVDVLRIHYSNPAFIIAGDFNQMKKGWLSSSLSLKQVVHMPTHVSGSILDLILTNLAKSDHFAILWKAHSSLPKPKLSRVVTRPLTESAIRAYGQWIGNYDFPEVDGDSSIHEKTKRFSDILYSKYTEIFPTKSVTISEFDKPWITPSIKKLIRERCRLYSIGDVVNAKKLRNYTVTVIRKAKRQYGRLSVSPMRVSNPKKWHRSVRKMSGKSTTSSVRILDDSGKLLTATDVNSFFTEICTTHPLPTESQKADLLYGCSEEEVIEVTEEDVFKELMKIKPNSASYPSELPVKLVREYAPFIAKPLSVLINLCFMLGTFPDIWKKAYIRVIPKSGPPKACDELRLISITPCLAKVTEAFVLRRLLDQISSSVDKYQYGGLQECSTTIYLVRMYDCILTWLDKGNRKQRVYALFEGDSDSDWTGKTCGSPQGTKLAAIVFIAVINYLLVEYEDHYKFIDDISFLLKYLVENGIVKKEFSDDFFDAFIAECNVSKLIINTNKSKVLRFNPLKRTFSQPYVPFPTVDSIKILGVTFSSDCSFGLHVENVVKNANACLQSLSTMRRFGCDVQCLLLAYLIYVRPVLEYASPLWGPAALRTVHLIQELESVQKRAVFIIIGDRPTILW
ncbi:uncharacterized protein LOC136028533 [Artemia franciscana]|uniref:uncharacterized protein LOC136028533 n=1 Tax=Artemia franciscana TaxID=6661 RepID=UPI0032DA8CBF